MPAAIYGCLVSSTILTLFVVPVLYRIVALGLPRPVTEDDDEATLPPVPATSH